MTAPLSDRLAAALKEARRAHGRVSYLAGESYTPPDEYEAAEREADAAWAALEALHRETCETSKWLQST